MNEIEIKKVVEKVDDMTTSANRLSIINSVALVVFMVAVVGFSYYYLKNWPLVGFCCTMAVISLAVLFVSFVVLVVVLASRANEVAKLKRIKDSVELKSLSIMWFSLSIALVFVPVFYILFHVLSYDFNSWMVLLTMVGVILLLLIVLIKMRRKKVITMKKGS